jgi:hypothetical protein
MSTDCNDNVFAAMKSLLEASRDRQDIQSTRSQEALLNNSLSRWAYALGVQRVLQWAL